MAMDMKLNTLASLKAVMILFVLFSTAVSCHTAGAAGRIHLDQIQLPPGFKIQLYARDVPNARSMAMSPRGILFVGTRQAGKVYAVLDSNRDKMADFYCRTRVMESQYSHRLPHYPDKSGKKQAGQICSVCGGLAAG